MTKIVAAFIVLFFGVLFFYVPSISEASIGNKPLPGLVVKDINTMRHHFGLKPGRGNNSDSKSLIFGLNHFTDPPLPPYTTVAEYSIWGIHSAGTSIKAEARGIAQIIYGMVYEDGWMGPNTINVDCAYPTDPGCNGHQQAILSNIPGEHLRIAAGVRDIQLNGQNLIEIDAVLIWIPN